MHRNLRIIAVFALSVLLLSACNSKPDHRRYIPKDAAVVVGVNVSSLGKKIAWNKLTGSKLFKEMEHRMPNKNGSDVLSGIDKAGVDILNTFYVYLKPDTRFNTGMKVTAIVPLTDADAWEAYLKKNFPKSAVTEHGKLRVADMDGNMYMGWDKHILIVMNSLTDNGDMAGELDNAFNIGDDNSIKADKHFEQLQGAGHDLSMWVNYAQIMNAYDDRMGQQNSGISVSPAMWKETAFACGFDFVKGKITGDMSYYTSQSMEAVYKKMGADNVATDMIDRLPGRDLDLMMALRFSPKALRDMMDSTGMLGVANGQLRDQGTNVDNILEAFTGDMAFTINDLSVGSNNDPDAGSPFRYKNFCMSVVIKINKKENFNQLLTYASAATGMLPVPGGFTMPVSTTDSAFVVYDDKYAVFSNKYQNATAILQGKSGQPLSPALAGEAKKHPFSLFADVTEAMNKVDMADGSPGDIPVYEETKKLLSSISVNGGEYKNNAIQGHLEINFTNKDENSIVTLLDYGMRMSDAMQRMNDTPSADTFTDVPGDRGPAAKKAL